MQDHPNKVQLGKEVWEFEALDPNEVHNNSTPILLDFSKVQLKDVHALQRVEVTEIWIRRNNIDK